ncbi:MAG: hypothetical protein SGJ02_06730, partial [bacterium]|nr:hypothetical protein [bacterium]
MDTQSFEIDQFRGFLPAKDPLTSLSSYFAAWEQAASELPKLLVTDRIRGILDQLPILDTQSLTNRSEIERSMMVISYLGHAYVWGEKKLCTLLPKCIAIPWQKLSLKLGRPPVLSYASYALWNWKRIDPFGPLALGNIALLQNFLGGIDEEWFILIHVDIEAKAAQAINVIEKAFEACDQLDSQGLINALKDVSISLININKTMDRMTEHCDPYIYYNRVRPYIHGWKDNPSTPNGIIYDGVIEYKGHPQKFRGETGAQSSIIPALDALLGIHHDNDPLRHYLNEMRDYMPPKHNEFIKSVEAHGSIRNFVSKNKETNIELKDIYNHC